MILEKIISHKKTELSKRKRLVTVETLKDLLVDFSPPRPLAPALRRTGEAAVIAEIKKASPTKGIIQNNLNPVKLAVEYEAAGAASISVLTEEEFFHGHPLHLSFVSRVVNIPVLRKDFIIDSYQIYESRALGADAILLIVSVLTDVELKKFMALAGELGLSCLVEVHTEQELYRAISAGAKIIGINNRDLRTFKVDLNRTFELSSKIDKEKITVVSESGIKSREDLLSLKENGIHAALVGEALVRHSKPGEMLKEMISFPFGEAGGGSFRGSF